MITIMIMIMINGVKINNKQTINQNEEIHRIENNE